jgi:hypothetical protein
MRSHEDRSGGLVCQAELDAYKNLGLISSSVPAWLALLLGQSPAADRAADTLVCRSTHGSEQGSLENRAENARAESCSVRVTRHLPTSA